MSRVINFSAGPAALPLEVLEQAKAEIPDWQGSGMSVMEISHRSKAFIAVAEQAEADLRELLGHFATTTRSCSCRAERRRSSRCCR